MKQSDGFDARRLRPRKPRSWRLRFGTALSVLLAALGLFLTLMGLASLLGLGDALGDLASGRDTALVVLLLGLVLLWAASALWRRIRRRMRQPDQLSMSPHLMKKRN